MLILARIVLVVLAVYHLSAGTLSVFSHAGAERFVARFYGVTSLDGSPQLRYAVRMLGLQALALGALAGVAAWDPAGHRDVIAVLAALQASRAACRVMLRRSLRVTFGIPEGRNLLNASLLLVEAVILVAVLT
jgi:hypothetical protein